MGAGKTTIGKAMARRLGVTFIDLDWYVEGRYHRTINQLFAERGEEGFRRIERAMLHEVGEFDNVVIATGGGTPCFFDNIAYMNQQGPVVYLRVGVDVLFERLKAATAKRPILRGKTDDELRTFIAQALRQRLPYYTQARYTFDAERLDDRKQINEAVDAIRRLINE